MSLAHLIHLEHSHQRQLEKKRLAVKLHPTNIENQYCLSNYSLTTLIEKKIPFKKIKSISQKNYNIEIIFPSRSHLFAPPSQDAVEEIKVHAVAKFPQKREIQIIYMGRRSENHEKDIIILDRPGGRRSYQWKIPETVHQIQDIRKMFPEISQKIKNRHTKVIISLGAGGIRLFAHPSLFKFIDLLELRPYIDEIWGSSGGAIAGLPYAMGVSPSQIEEEGYHLYNDRYSFRLSPSKFDVVKNLISDTFLTSSEYFFQGLIDCQSALSDLIGKYISQPTQAVIPFFCMAYNLTRRRSEVLTPENIDSSLYLTPIIQTDPLDAIIASSSIPILYVPKTIRRNNQEEHYIDGGTTEENPLLSPYRKWIRDKLNKREKRKKLLIISVNLFPEVGSTRLFNHWILRKLPPFKLLELSATYTDLVRQSRIDEHKNHLARDPNVTLWELNLPLPGTGIVNTKRIPLIIQTAQHTFFDQLLKIEENIGKKE
ncbi:MAG: patatin-like phospholipase family protein [Deltaproteobacteria bacterium]|nr:patatin-like phospholipase family protein [Deltaproteobacteria bacterium]